jgi:glutaminyl-peptide cyclotransferase
MSANFQTQKSVFFFAIALFSLPILFSCCSGNKTSGTKNKLPESKTPANVFEVFIKEGNKIVNQGDTFSFWLKTAADITPDSIELLCNNNLIALKHLGANNYSALALTNFVGSQVFKTKIFYSDSLTEKHQFELFVLSDQAPKIYSYKILRKFQHDPKAYTQGLLYFNGFIYESTGRKNQSSIRKINTQTGEVVNKKALEPEFFGEGITLINNEIFMITYVSQVGFVFDIETFDLKRKFNLQTREGWGLTTCGSELIQSDGSAKLFFFEPEYFSLTKEIEVCDNKGLISNINELEYTPYGLFANIYGENNLVIIDEKTGIVKAKVDLTDLFPKGVPVNYDHVLNGIAYNPDRKTFYVTGKQWPVMYEILINID